jgi:hypothetical protein
VTLRQGLKPHGFFCLSSVRDGLSDGAWLRLGAHRSGGGKAEGASPSRRILCWAVPGPLFFPCLSERDEWPTTPVSGVLGKSNTRIFRCCSPGNVPAGAEAFPDALVRAAPRAFSRGLATRTFGTAHSVAQWFNTVVCLPTALRHGTHTRFSCSRCYFSLLTRVGETGSARAQARFLSIWETRAYQISNHSLRKVVYIF